MNVVHSIRLKDVGVFKDVELKVEPGITVLYGLNRSGGRASKNSNGVGKSLITSSLADLLYEEPIVGEKSDRMRVGSRYTSFTVYRGRKVDLSRVMNGRSEKIGISVDDKELKLRTSTYNRQTLKKLWPISQEEYQTYVHIDGRIPHPLVMGKSVERKAFFTAFFGLDKMDAERKLYTAELSKLSKIKSAFQELRTAYTKAKLDLLDTEAETQVTELVTKYRQQLKNVQQRFNKAQDILRLLNFATSAKSHISTLAKACGGTITEEEVERCVSDNKWELKKATSDLEDAENWTLYQRETSNYTKAIEKLSKSTRARIEKYGVKKALTLAKAKTKERRELLHKSEELREEIGTAKYALDRLKLERVMRPQGELADLETALRSYVHQLEHALQFKSGTCETCGQSVTVKDPRTLESKVTKLRSQIEQHRTYTEFKKAQAERTKLTEIFTSASAELEEVKAKSLALTTWSSVYEELIDLPSKPSPFEGKKLQAEVMRRVMAELVERRSLFDYLVPHLETILEFQALTKDDLELATQVDDMSERMNRVQERLAKVQVKLEVHKTVKTRISEMRTRLVSMKHELKDEPALKLLVQGFQDKVMKKMAVEAIGQRLMALVNTYAAAAFPENYRFEIQWGSQVDILVHRKYGKRVLTSDVRKLSGAESTIFTLILVCALFAFVPSHKRCNLLILDEPSARLSKEMTDVLQHLLKVLNKFIPSIIVVTPKNDEIFEGARALTIVKQNGYATIRSGFPHQQTSN